MDDGWISVRHEILLTQRAEGLKEDVEGIIAAG